MSPLLRVPQTASYFSESYNAKADRCFKVVQYRLKRRSDQPPSISKPALFKATCSNGKKRANPLVMPGIVCT